MKSKTAFRIAVPLMLLVCPSCSSGFRIDASALGEEGRSVRCGHCRHVWHATVDQAVAEPVEVSSAANVPSVPSPATGSDDDWGAAFADEATEGHDPKPAAAKNSAPAEAEAPAQMDETTSASALSKSPVVESPPLVPEGIEALASRRSRRPYVPPPKRNPMTFRMNPPILVILLCSMIMGALILGREVVVRSFPGAASIYASMGFHINLRGIEFQGVTTVREVQDGIAMLLVEGDIVNLTGKTIDVPRIRFAIRDQSGREIYNWTAAPPRPLLGSAEAMRFTSRLASPPAESKDVLVRFVTRFDAP